MKFPRISRNSQLTNKKISILCIISFVTCCNKIEKNNNHSILRLIKIYLKKATNSNNPLFLEKKSSLSSLINIIFKHLHKNKIPQNQNHDGSHSILPPLSHYRSKSKDYPRCNGIANWKRSRNGKIGWKGREKKAAFPSHPFKRTPFPLWRSREIAGNSKVSFA